MARIRSIKPSFFLNEDLADLSAIVRLLFIGLWTQADKEGRLLDRPKRLKAEIFPYSNVNLDVELSRLQSAGFIERYEVGELKVIQIKNFTVHQRITGSEAQSESVLPAPPKAAQKSEQTGGNTSDHFGNTLEIPRTTGREGKGKEGKGDITRPKANIPSLEEVVRFFRGAGATEEMAKKYWNAREGVQWEIRGSPIRNWASNANNFIVNYHENEKNHGRGRVSTTTDSIQAIDRATADLIRDIDEAARQQPED